MARKKSYKRFDKLLDKHGNKRFVTVKFRVVEMGALVKTLGVDKRGKVQEHFTDVVMRHLKDFMPQESGKLVGTMYKASGTRIRVQSPYARFLFFGLTKDGKPVRYDNMNPQGTSHWDRRMVAARGRAIARQMALNLTGR